jgi:hypothetical protein
MNVRKLALAGTAMVFWVLLLGAVSALPALAAAPEVPEVTVEGVSASGATFSDVLNPSATFPVEAGTYQFFYRKTKTAGCEDESKAPASPTIYTGSEPFPVSEPVSGLAPDVYYTVCLHAETTAKDAAQSTPVTFETAPEEPTTSAATPVKATEATLHGVLNPNNAGEPGTFEFHYRASATECKGENEVATAQETLTGVKGQEAKAELTGLQPGTQYTYCLLARNEAGATALSIPPLTFTTLAEPPTVTNEAVTNVEAYAATLNAEINPRGGATMYHFEYDTREYKEGEGPHGQSTPETSLGATDNTSHPVSAQLEELHPSTTYYYRVVASNASSPGGGTTAGPSKTLTTYALPGSTPAGGCANEQRRAEQPYGLDLPDCRAYEMVSPLEKGDQGVQESHPRAAVSGEAVTYTSKGSFAEAPGQSTGAAIASRYVSRRGPNGWSTQNITPPREVGGLGIANPYEELLFSPDLSQGVTGSEFYPLTDGSPAESRKGYFNFYTADIAAGSYKLVNTVEPGVPPYTEEYDEYQTGWPALAGASADFSDVVYNQDHHVYDSVDGRVIPVDVPPAGTTLDGEDSSGAGVAGHELPAGEHVISEDGSRVFFTAGEAHPEGSIDAFNAENEKAFGQLYVRENPGSPNENCSIVGDACTIEVSASQRTNSKGEPAPDPNDPATAEDPNGIRVAMFWSANAEGTKVLFTSRAELTNEAYTGEDDNAANLYEYEVSSVPGQPGRLTDLSVDTNPNDKAEGATVLGVVATSDDGSYVYFAAEGNLQQASKNAEGQEASSGQPNLYLYRSESPESLSFITTLGAGDQEDWWGGRKYQANAEQREEQQEASQYIAKGGPVTHEVRMTPDGKHLAFLSKQDLTGYDNGEAKSGKCEERTCNEIYVYEAATGRLACASCDPSGARPVGEAGFGGGGSTYYAQRNWSEEGGRLFFETPDPLVLRDNNGLQDVYEYADGHVYPISDVTGDYGSNFLDASANGDDVFILTADQLLPSDTDTRADVYDARVGGGFPVSVAPSECDNGDSCKPPAAPQPGVFAPSGSATFAGAGNPTPVVAPTAPKEAVKKSVRCKRNFTRKHGKCVKRKVRRSSKHSKKRGK